MRRSNRILRALKLLYVRIVHKVRNGCFPGKADVTADIVRLPSVTQRRVSAARGPAQKSGLSAIGIGAFLAGLRPS